MAPPKQAVLSISATRGKLFRQRQNVNRAESGLPRRFTPHARAEFALRCNAVTAPTFTITQMEFLARMRVARLATADAAGHPHVIPIVFATDSQRLYTPVDAKPKRATPRELKRVRNLLANPEVAVVVDEYDDDWTRLAWVLVTGRGELLESGEAHAAGIQLLQQKYSQYGAMPLEGCPVIVVTPARVTSWGALFCKS